jgi:hypothetical protein
MKNLQDNMLIGVWSGSIAGFIVLFSQSLLKLYNQELNMILAFSLILAINSLIIILVTWYNSRKE